LRTMVMYLSRMLDFFLTIMVMNEPYETTLITMGDLTPNIGNLLCLSSSIIFCRVLALWQQWFPLGMLTLSFWVWALWETCLPREWSAAGNFTLVFYPIFFDSVQIMY
jgi:hypothetical protein